MKVKEEKGWNKRARDLRRTLRWKATVAAGGGDRGWREASFDGLRVPGLPRDLTLTESQK